MQSALRVSAPPALESAGARKFPKKGRGAPAGWEEAAKGPRAAG